MQRRNVSLVFSDALLAGLVVLLTVFYLMEQSASSEVYMFFVWSMTAVYLLSRIVLTIAPRVACYALLAAVAVFCLKESYIGLMQILGHFRSNHYMYACTGSFNNPGPYGGFLAVCICVLGAYAIKGRNKLFRSISGITSLIALILLPSTMSRTAMLAVGCVAFLLLASTDVGKTIFKKYRIWLILAVVIASSGAYMLKKPSADGRFFMNRISIIAINSNGMDGACLGRFGAAYGEAQARYFGERMTQSGDDTDWTALKESDRLTADCPQYAFNEYLQLGVEGGPVVMLFFISLIITAITVSYKRGDIWCYGLLALSVFAMFSYPLHIVQFQVLLAVLLAVCATPRSEGILGGSVLMAVALIISLLFLISRLPWMNRLKEASEAWKKTERWYNMEYYYYVTEDADSLYDSMRHDYWFLFAYGQSLSKEGQYLKSNEILSEGSHISSDPMFWIVMGNNNLSLERYEEAERCYKHAFHMVPNRLYPLCRLAELYVKMGDYDRFNDMKQKIDRFKSKVESPTTDKLRARITELSDSITSINEQR
jgi:tetratricopeptide (TPR) repeat protein